MHHSELHRQIRFTCDRMNTLTQALNGTADLTEHSDFDPATVAWLLKSAARDFSELSEALLRAIGEMKAPATEIEK